MSPKTLFETFNDIDDHFVVEAANPPVRRLRRSQIATIAACAALIVTGAVIACVYRSDAHIPLSDSETTSPSYDADNADASSALSSQTPPTTTTSSSEASPVVTYPPSDKRVIADIQNSAGGLACYARGPYPGECWIDLYGPSIAENVDENTVYWSELYLHDENGRVFAGDVVHTEAKRLAALGYEIYVREDYWTGYWGEEKHVTHLCGYFTKEHLEQFPSSDNLGYMIDYSREDVAACERVLP